MNHRAPPPLPPERPPCFRATVHGTVFADRASHISRLHAGDEVLLTMMEHHADFVPWLHAAQDLGFETLQGVIVR